MLGLDMLGDGNKDKWQQWRDALSRLSADISRMPDTAERDTLKQHADALYNSLMAFLPRTGTAAFEKAYCDAMASIAVQHMRIHHGIVQPEFGSEYPEASTFSEVIE